MQINVNIKTKDHLSNCKQLEFSEIWFKILLQQLFFFKVISFLLTIRQRIVLTFHVPRIMSDDVYMATPKIMQILAMVVQKYLKHK